MAGWYMGEKVERRFLLLKNKCKSLHLLHLGSAGASPRFKFMILSVCKDEKKKLTCSANLPRMCKGYIKQCCCPSSSPTAVSSRHSPVELPISSVWLVLLLFSPVGWVLHSLSISWASHIRRTSGVRHQEWSLWGTAPTTPTPLCLSLFIFQPFSSSLSLPFSFFLSACPSLFPHPLLFLLLHRQLPRRLAKLERLRYICWRAQCSSGRPSPANIPPACITASVQLMNTTEGMCQCPSPAFLFDKFHSQ